MKKSWLIGLLAVTAVFGFAAEAAAKPHFARAGASGPDGAGTLTVNFTIVGLGRTQVTVTASADARAVYACRDQGGNDTVVDDVQRPVSTSQQFASGAGSLTLTPPPSTLEQNPCQLKGQGLVLSSITFANVGVSEPSAGTVAIPGTF